jgi:outer membrane protein assembly factor BamB
MLFRRFVTGQLHSWSVVLMSLIWSVGFAAAAPNMVPQKDPMDWPNWRGPEQNRVSRETGLIDKWNPETKENVLWFRPEAAGISSPIVMNGKVYTQVRYKPDTKEEQEEVICLDANTGKPLWENRWNVYLSDVPAERIGWSSVVGDPKTGRIYALGVNGNFSCIDGETGKTVWSKSLGEEFGMISPYGGRTHPPTLFEDLVIVNAVMVGWGDTAVPAQRILALDKTTGEPRWFTHTNPKPEDTDYSTPTFTVLDGQAEMIVGSADGAVWAFQPRTGKALWHFRMSPRGLNLSPNIVGDKIYMAQGEENLDRKSAGSLVCFKADGTDDTTDKNEIWRMTNVLASKSSPLVVDGRVYCADDLGNLYIVDAETGKLVGNKSVKLIGTIVRSSPLYADGKIYLCTTTAWHVLQPTKDGVKFLAKMRMPEREEVSGSMAVSHGKIYLPTAEGMYCLGNKDAKPAVDSKLSTPPAETPAAATDAPAWLQIAPVELLLKPGQKQAFKVRAYNSRGQAIELSEAKKKELKFTLNGPGTIDAKGEYTAPTGSAPSATIVTVALGDLTGQARLRVVPPLPWKFDFNDTPLTANPANPSGPQEGEAPLTWVGARYRHKVREMDGDKVMVKITTIPKGTRSQSWMGPDDMHDYTIQADLRGKHNVQSMLASTTSNSSDIPSAQAINPSSAENPVLGLPDMGLIAQRYTLDLMGNSQQLQIRSWPPQVARRFSKTISFPWQGDKWYTMKFSASADKGKAVLRGKVWPRGEKEPDKWTIEAIDDVPNLQGSPGLFGQSSVSEIYIDNVSVTPNEGAAKR